MVSECNHKPKKIVGLILVPYYWEPLLMASAYWKVSSEEIMNTRMRKKNIVLARQTFYWLCFKKGLDLYKLSVYLGKHRCTIINSIGNYPRPDIIHNHVKNILNEKKIISNS